MKLTNAIKDAIANAVMQDTPEEFTYDQYRDAAMKIAVEKLPPKARALWDDKSMRDFVALFGYRDIYLPGRAEPNIPEIDALRERYQAASRARQELRRHVRNVVYQFTTDKQMIQHIPELEKYLPKPNEATKNLPATNLIADLVKAGWPKSE